MAELLFKPICHLVDLKIIEASDNVENVFEYLEAKIRSNVITRRAVQLRVDTIQDSVTLDLVRGNLSFYLQNGNDVDINCYKQFYLFIKIQRLNYQFGVAIEIPKPFVNDFLPFYKILKSVLLRCREPIRRCQTPRIKDVSYIFENPLKRRKCFFFE
uniref:Uncharacterized protein n=1 Tax=Panagrolaimus sp. JU765 TaxID=591449 RepID=A0AC34QKA9_9BILA